ncbi:MAG: phosphatidylserine decarboxylase family protein [Muribaculaceae bacterium]|nr:phosphatidylserine decarboxylase family protein [Muribaculaceae bacterium]
MPLKVVKIHREGTNILILLFIVLAALLVPVWLFMPPVVIPTILTTIAATVYLFVFNFFRCPKRKYTGRRKDHLVSSVDGRVVAIERVREPEWLKSEALMVSVFMSPLNVHANWFPADGRVDYVRHHAGRFLSAYLPKASTENERSTIGITMDNGRRIVVRQIAGAMARRIVTYAEVGEVADIDDHLGFIKFGSRVDIYLPVDAHVLLKIGDLTSGGLTPLAIVHPEKKEGSAKDKKQ